jgi:hypothetical protein
MARCALLSLHAAVVLSSITSVSAGQCARRPTAPCTPCNHLTCSVHVHQQPDCTAQLTDPAGCVQIVDELFVKDPNGAMLAFADMMRKQIVMPAHLMDDNQHTANTGRNLFMVNPHCLLPLHQRARFACSAFALPAPRHLPSWVADVVLVLCLWTLAGGSICLLVVWVREVKGYRK